MRNVIKRSVSKVIKRSVRNVNERSMRTVIEGHWCVFMLSPEQVSGRRSGGNTQIIRLCADEQVLLDCWCVFSGDASAVIEMLES